MDDVLLYTSPNQFVDYISTLEGGEEIGEQLENACLVGDVKTIKEILEANNIGVNARLRGGFTLLMRAAEYNQTRLADFLLSQTGINVSLAQQDGGTALSLALQVWKDFEGANYEMARQLINAGANINQVTFNHTVLLTVWYRGNQEAANALVTVLGANIDVNEHIFNSDSYRVQRCGAEGVPHQIALSKQNLEAYHI